MKVKNRVYNFVCLQRFLVALNLLFLIFGLLIATLPVYFHINKMLKSWPINGGIIAMGAFLVIVSIFGCYGARKQHQIILFFYMAILAMVCLLTFAFSVAALSLSKSQQNAVLARGWDSLSNNTRGDIQRAGDCCGFTDRKIPDYPSCENLKCFKTVNCPLCVKVLEGDWFITFRKSTGGVALFVSLLMCVSLYFTYRYRHLKNPVANANEFL